MRKLVKVAVGGEIPGTVIRVLAGPVQETGFGYTGYVTVFYLEVEVDA